MRRAQSSASRLVRNVLAWLGQPVFRMRAFHVPEGAFTNVANAHPPSAVDALNCTEIVPVCKFSARELGKTDITC